MRVSTKGRYALRLMTELARAKDKGCVPMRDIAEHQNISIKYLEQIVRPLSKAGLVNSVRGAQGGYYLSDDPSKISVGQVLRATEGDLSPVECVSDSVEACERADSCETMFVWRSLKEATDRVVDGIFISDLAEKSDAPCVERAVERINKLT